MPGTNVPQRVIFLYLGMRLGAQLLALHGEHRHVNVISSPVELINGPPADVVVIDVPAPDRRAACEQVRRHHRGPLIVLLDQRESGRNLPSDHNRTLLTRPFSIRQLSVALTMPAPTLPTWDPAAHPPARPTSRRPTRWAGHQPWPGTASGRTGRSPAGAKLAGTSPHSGVGHLGHGRSALHGRVRGGQSGRPLRTGV